MADLNQGSLTSKNEEIHKPGAFYLQKMMNFKKMHTFYKKQPLLLNLTQFYIPGKCQTVTALPLIEKLNRYKMILDNILERRNDFEKHFWKIGYSFMAIKGRYNCKYRKSLRPCKHCPLIKHLLFPENAMDGNSNSNHWKN